MKIRISMFTKLFIIIIVTGAVINMMVGGFFRYQFIHSDKSNIDRNLSYYADYLIREIGIPPDLKKAREISHKTRLEISITGPSLRWSSFDIFPDIGSLKMTNRYNNTRFYSHDDKLLLMKECDGYRFIFYNTNMPMKWKWGGESILILILMLTAVLISAYALIRRILWPVKFLSKGVKEIASGNLEYQVPVRNRDELGELTESFNSMKNRLKEMLRSREQLLLNVSHELRSPLTRIKVALEFIEDESLRGTVGEDVREIEGMITEILESERLKHIDGMLDIEEIDIASLITEVAGTLDIVVSAIKIEPHMSPVIVKGDRTWIKIVMRNVLENAIKNSDPKRHPIEVSFPGDDSFSVVITDHGPGIPEKDLPYVFDPFYRVDTSRSRKTGGYGLGLSLCKKIMDSHGGSITIINSPGVGASVKLKFSN
jgi:signal transduction histidine kinase